MDMGLHFEFKPPGGGAVKKVMIVDDDELICETLITLLKKQGYTAVTVPDGNGVLLEARREKPGLILLDLMIPPLNGYKVLEDLKADAELKSVPVFLITGLTDRDMIDRGRKLGAAGVIQKPFRTDYLLRVLETHYPKASS